MTAARCCLAPIRPGTDAYHAPHRVEPTLALGAEATVRFLALGMQSRIPSSRIDLHTCTGQGRRARRTGSASRARSWAAYRIQTRPSARPRARPTSRLAGSRWKSKRKARPAHSQEAHRQLHGVFGVLHLELVNAPLRLAQLAALGLLVRSAGRLAPTVLRPLVRGLGIGAGLPAVLYDRPFRRDCIVVGLPPELVGVLGGWVGHGVRPFGSRWLHCKASHSARSRRKAVPQKVRHDRQSHRDAPHPAREERRFNDDAARAREEAQREWIDDDTYPDTCAKIIKIAFPPGTYEALQPNGELSDFNRTNVKKWLHNRAGLMDPRKNASFLLNLAAEAGIRPTPIKRTETEKPLSAKVSITAEIPLDKLSYTATMLASVAIPNTLSISVQATSDESNR